MRSSSVFEISVAIGMSAVVALMVAYSGAALEAASRAPLPGDGIAPKATFVGENSQDDMATLGIPTPGPDPMIWCRPLNGNTVCLREQT